MMMQRTLALEENATTQSTNRRHDTTGSHTAPATHALWSALVNAELLEVGGGFLLCAGFLLGLLCINLGGLGLGRLLGFCGLLCLLLLQLLLLLLRRNILAGLDLCTVHECDYD